MQESVVPALRSAGITAVDVAGMKIGARALFDEALTLIQRCDFIVAEMTGAATNVAYEVGLATGLGKKALILTERPDQTIPYLVARYPIVAYSLGSSEPAQITERVAEALNRFTIDTGPTPTEYDLIPPEESITVRFRREPAVAQSMRTLAGLAEALELTGDMQPSLQRVRAGSLLVWLNVGDKARRVAQTLLGRFREQPLREAQADEARGKGELARAQARDIPRQSAREDALAAMDIAERLVRLAEENENVGPFSIVIGGIAKIERDESGNVSVLPPEPRELGAPPDRRSLPPG